MCNYFVPLFICTDPDIKNNEYLFISLIFIFFFIYQGIEIRVKSMDEW